MRKNNTGDFSSPSQELEYYQSLIEEFQAENVKIRSQINFSNDSKKKRTHQARLSHFQPSATPVSRSMKEPTLEYELARRRTKRDLNEMWWYIRARLEFIAGRKSNTPEFRTNLENIISSTQHRHQAIQTDFHHMTMSDGFQEFRDNETKNLSDLIQKRIYTLQNPQSCARARKLVCHLNKGCGYGCQIHHALYCFIIAYGTERMLVLESRGWRYDPQGFEHVFLPLSETCPNFHIGHTKTWPATDTADAIELGIIDSINPRPKYLPPSIPKDLSERMLKIHGNPVLWWLSQFLKFLLRPQSSLSEMLQSIEEAQQFAHPIVGVHVRRTDKVGTEAAFHGVEEYMKYVEEYYDSLEIQEGQPVTTKRVYIASDDSKILSEFTKMYPDYVFIGDTDISKSAAVASRYNSASLRGVITDIHMLSISDYLVCTFSSQVCRLAYEIMQTYHTDAADRFKSLDDIWYYGGQSEHQQVAIMDHIPNSRHEVELKKGDKIGVAGNHWDGFNKGRNHRNGKMGLYPEYKTKESYRIVDFPTYSHVKL